jgi:general secretion pathway protein K
MMTLPSAQPKASQRGFVIVAVLWILVALSSLAMIFALYLSASARAMAVGDTALQNEALASAGVELTAYQLILAHDDARPARGSFHFRMDDADVSVNFTSEAARIDLNFAPKEVLAAFFTGLGADKDGAMEDAERIVGWRTRPVPGSANDEETRYAALGYSPRQSLFTHVNELALVAGLSPALVDRALPFVTVFNGSSDVDATIAAPEVVAAFSKGGNATSLLASADLSAAQKSEAPVAKSPCYRVETTIGFANGRRATSEVVIVLGDKAEPYRVLSWQDDVEPRNIPALRRRS